MAGRLGENFSVAAASGRLTSVIFGAATRRSTPGVPVLAATKSALSTQPAAPTAAEILAPVKPWNRDLRYARHTATNAVKAFKYRVGLENPSKNPNRKRIVLLGTGWAAMRFLPTIDTSKYEVILVSPRNFFVFTPLLPSVCSGALSVRSCVEPIRRFILRGGKRMVTFYEGYAEDVDFSKDSVKVAAKNGHRFEVPYDYLLVSVGSEAATFGIPGVAEHTSFLKGAEDAESIRRKVMLNFELASLPCTSEEEQRRLLHFVCVGGGPSGVETAAEVADLVKEDIGRCFPSLAEKARVSVIEMLPKVLSTFGDEVSEFTREKLTSMNVDALLKTRVTSVDADAIHVVNAKGQDQKIPCGFVLWASGIGQTPFAKRIMAKIPEQKNNRPAVINVDERMRIKGVTHNNAFALGDCSFVNPVKLSDYVDELYKAAQANPSGAGTDFLKKTQSIKHRFPQVHIGKCAVTEDRNNLTKDQFIQLCMDIDKGYKPPPPTAQHAGQAGRWLACMLNDYDPATQPNDVPAFVDKFKGALAYIGDGDSVAALPGGFKLLGGYHSTVFWRFVYWSMQMSVQNRLMILSDWIRLSVVGRDLSSPSAAADLLRDYPPAPEQSDSPPEKKLK